MKRSVIETILGALVILVAGIFLIYSYQKAGVGAGSGGYQIVANFSGIGGLKAGDDVQISGVKIGTVSGVSLDPETFLARVYMMVDSSVQLPLDTAALISSESLLGGRYLALEPGADEELIQPGGTVQFTQAPQNLEQLLGQFIFSVSEDKSKDHAGGEEQAGGGAAGMTPAPAMESHPDPAEEVAPALEEVAPSDPAPAPEEAAPAPQAVPQDIPEAAPESAPEEEAAPPATTEPVESEDAPPAQP